VGGWSGFEIGFVVAATVPTKRLILAQP